MTGRRSHGRLSALNGVVHQGNDEVQAGARAGAPKREGEMLTASRERGVIGCREIDAQPPEDRGQDALGLTQRSVEDETERQGGFDGEIGRLELPAPPADASRCPRGDRVGREPEGDVASPHERSVVLGPVPDAIRCRVLRMHSRLHIEIMTRRRSRWSTCRPLLAHRAESAHQRPDGPWGTQLMRHAPDAEDGCLRHIRVLIHDRDPLFRPAGREFVAHHHERNHQGLDNRLILPLSTAPPPRGRVLVPPAARWDVELLLSVSSVIHDRPSTPRSSFWTVRRSAAGRVGAGEHLLLL